MNGRSMIQDWLNRTVKVQITDGRTLIGTTLDWTLKLNLELDLDFEFEFQFDS